MAQQKWARPGSTWIRLMWNGSAPKEWHEGEHIRSAINRAGGQSATGFVPAFGAALIFFVSNVLGIEAHAQTAESGVREQAPNTTFSRSGDDIQNQLNERLSTKAAVFPSATFIQTTREELKRFGDPLQEKYNLDLGLSVTTAYSTMSDSLPDTEDHGFGYGIDFTGHWKVLNVGSKWEGSISWLGQARDKIFTDASPGDLFVNAAAFGGPMDQFDSDEQPVLREMYWQQGSKDAHFMYRAGKLAPDTLVLAISQFDSASLDFMGLAEVLKLAIRKPDPGFGFATGYYPQGNSTLRPHIQLVVSDSNGNREDRGDLGEGEFFKGIEFGFRPFPRTEKAPFWRFSAWHNDEQTEAGIPDGYGVAGKIEQELSDDGDVIGILQYSHSWEGAPAENHVTARLVISEPFRLFRKDVDLTGDRLGFGVAWMEPASEINNAQNEYHLEAYYRFPLIPNLDMTLDVQYLIDPSLSPVFEAANPGIQGTGDIFAFNLRFRSVF